MKNTDFAFDTPSAEDFARGWPHLRRVVDGHPDDASSKALAALKRGQFETSSAGGIYYVDWPRGLAQRWIRSFAADVIHDRIDLGDPSPISAAEAKKLIAKAVCGKGNPRLWHVEDAVFLLEALHGPGTVFGAVVDALEQAKPAPALVPWIVCAGLLRLRMNSDAARKAGARLAAWRDRLASAPSPVSTAARSVLSEWIATISIAADGRAPRKGPGAIAPPDLVQYGDAMLNAVGDPESVRAASTRPAHRPTFGWTSIRLAYLGGDGVLEGFENEVWLFKDSPPAWHARMAAQLEAARRPAAMRLLAEMALRSNARPAALDGLRRRSDFATPVLEAVKDKRRAAFRKLAASLGRGP